jgi:homopolymeric O-antigen transport system permease protein
MVRNEFPVFKHYLNVVRHLVARDFSLRYAGSALGVLWSILIPLVQLGVLIFTFRRAVPVNIKDYPAFVYSALLPWTWFSSCLGSAGGLFLGQKGLVRRPNFPPLILVVVNTLSNLLIFLLSLPLLFALLAWNGRSLTASLATLPLLFMIQAFMTIGLGLAIASWNVLFRDVSQLVNIILSFVFFLTPIFYRAPVDSKYGIIFKINPVAGLIRCYRAVLFEGRPPACAPLLAVSAVSIAALGLGYLIYKHQLPDVVDTI